MGQFIRILTLVLWLALIDWSIQVDYRPELNLVTPTVTLLANSTFEVQCSGFYKLHWIYPADWRSLISSKAIVNESHDPNSIKPFVSTLTIEDLEYRFTGRYICASTVGFPPDEENFDDERSASASIYLYVYDEEHLLAPLTNQSKYLPTFSVFASRTLIIPCRPTRPEISVELTGDQADLNQTAIFDPRRGFIFKHPTTDLQGVAYCHASYENMKKSYMIYLQFQPESTITPVPLIDTSEAMYPTVGKPFTLDCIVHKDHTTLVAVEWRYPEGNDDIDIRNTTHSEVTVRSQERFLRLSKKLYVYKATGNHTGNYTCKVITQTQNYYHTVHLNVLGQSPDPFVNLSSHVVSPVFVNKDIKIKMVVNYDVHMADLKSEIRSEWTKDGLLLVASSRITFISNRTTKQEILLIQSAETNDTGNYTLFVKIGEDGPTFNWTVAIFVRSKAFAYVSNAKRFYKKGEKFTLRCNGDGYPTAKVWWKWSPCTNTEKCDKPWIDVNLNSSLAGPPNSAFVSLPTVHSLTRVSRNLTVIAGTSGSFLCKTENVMGELQKPIAFMVAEDSKGHWITDNKEKPIEGQEFNMTCGASKFAYKALNWSTTDREITEKENGNIIIVKHMNSLSVFSTLVFLPLNLNHTRDYLCTAIPISEGIMKSTVHRTLNVAGRLAPRFLNESLPGTVNYELSPQADVQFLCDHEMGRPPSKVEWYKDGVKLDQTDAIKGQGSSHTITRIMATDAGLYTCIINNSAGLISRNFSLVIQPEAEVADASQWIYIGIFMVVLPILIVLIVILLRKIYKERRARREQEILEKYLFDRGQMSMYNPELPLDEQVNLLPYNQKWEFPRDRLRLGRVLGQGAFGRVVKAEAVGLDDSETHTTVAVKMLKERADSVQLKALVAELKILIHLGSHLNILNLLGAVTKNMGKGELMVIVEYCRYGNIRNYLLRYRSNFKDQLDPVTGRVDVTRMTSIDDDEYLNPKEQLLRNGFSNPNYHGASSRPDTKLNYAHLEHIESTTGSEAATTYPATPGASSTSPWDTAGYTTSSGSVAFRSRLASEGMTMTKKSLCTCDLLCFAFQCARGMEYLASRKLIHRDLAARNVLLAEDNIVKICDFGLTKECYNDEAYVKKNDGPLPIKWMAIESIGDKIFTTKSDVWAFGVLLWEFFTLGGNPYPGIELDEDFYRKLRSGYRMEKPRYAPDDLYALMTNCWHDDPTQRPPFDIMAQKLGDFLEAGVKQYYVDLNTPYMEMNCRDPPPVDYLSMGTQGEGSNYLTMATDPSTEHYDNVTNVRPVEGEGPAPLQPLEVISMIQLEPVTFAPANKNKSNRKPLEPPITPIEANKGYRQPDSVGDVESDLLGRYPSTEDDDEVSSVVFELNSSMDKSNEDYMTMGHVTHLERSRKGNESLRSAASSGFHSDLEVPERVSPPPYNLVMENVR